jgi:hypothetical protein
MRYWTLLALLVAGAVFTWPCGPFFPEFEYAPKHGPVKSAAEIDQFDRGNLGVVRPEFYRQNLVVAYRYLSGVPLTEAEVKALERQPAVYTGPPDQFTATARWLTARKQVGAAPPIQSLRADKQVPGSNWQYFDNCLDTAFDTAAATLRDRIAKWSAQSPAVAEWLRGQDQVFENCSGGPVIPAPLTAGDPLLAADRQYQIAAAEFYAGKYADAERDFDAVAANANSPWRDGGHYLAARALIRDGTVHSKPESLKAAEPKLKAVIADPAQEKWHASARGLTEFIHATADPQGRLVEVAAKLTHPGADFDQAMTDYTRLYDRLEEQKAELPTADNELTDWIDTLQNRKSERAVEKWRAGKSMPWLVAALSASPANDPAVPELIAAARKIAPEATAYASATIYGIRLERKRGQVDAAREWADRALETKQLDSTVNFLRAERLAMARDWSEFLKFGPRKPVAIGSEGVWSDGPLREDPGLPKRPLALDDDFTGPMNTSVPLELWDAAARGDALPRVFQAEIAQAGWVRAVLIDDRVAARKLAARAGELNPPLAPAASDYLAQSDPAAAQFTAVFWMLRLPGLQPELRSGLGRVTSVNAIDNLRDNWWGKGEAKMSGADFLPAAQRASGEEQAAQLRKNAANAVNYLCPAAIAWAKAHPRDPRVPEALHLAVRATRYGPADKESSGYSKEAFDILHKTYPNSPWTNQTKYWY